MLTHFLHIPTPPGSAHRALSFLRTEPAFQAVPVFRMAYFLQTAHCAVCRKTLMLQVRFAHPPSTHRNAPSEHSGVPHGLLGSESTPCSLYPKRSCFRLASLALRCRTEPALRAAPVLPMGGGSFALPLLRTDPPSVRRCSAGLIGFAKRSGSRLASLTLRRRTDPPSVRRCFGRLIFRKSLSAFSSKRSTSSRFAASGGRGKLRSPLHPSLPPPAHCGTVGLFVMSATTD